jgi:GT2 family glycosyltransferase
VNFEKDLDLELERRRVGSYRPGAVAAIVVNWNSGELLCRCLAALSKQSVQLWRIVVVDNASSKDSAELNVGYCPRSKLIQLEENKGFAAANNLAASELTSCEWVALVNPDAFPEPQWLEKMLAAAQEYPDYTAFGCKMLTAGDADRIDGAGDVYHVSGAAWRRGHGQATRGRHIKVEEIFSPCAAAALYRRDVFLEIGGFDDSYFCYFEDVDLGFRLRLAGHRCLYVPDAVVHHVGSATTGERSDFTTYHGQRNLVWTYFKNMPWPLFWLYLPQHFLLNILTLVWFSLRGQGKVILKAKWDALKGLPGILKERPRIQKARRVSVWALRRMMAKGLLTPYLRRHV